MFAVYFGAFYPSDILGVTEDFWKRFFALMAPIAALGGAYVGWVTAKMPSQQRADLWLFCGVLVIVSILFVSGDQRIFGSPADSNDKFLREFAVQVGSVLVTFGLIVLIKRKGG